MPIRNYSSGVSASRSIGQAMKLLASSGARRIATDYDADGEPEAVTFTMIVGDGPVSYRLAPDPAGMLRAMERDKGVPRSKCTPEQAKRTAWKNELDWLDAQLAKVAGQQARLSQLLLGYAVTDNGETFHDRLLSTPARRLLLS